MLELKRHKGLYTPLTLVNSYSPLVVYSHRLFCQQAKLNCSRGTAACITSCEGTYIRMLACFVEDCRCVCSRHTPGERSLNSCHNRPIDTTVVGVCFLSNMLMELKWGRHCRVSYRHTRRTRPQTGYRHAYIDQHAQYFFLN